MPYDPYGRRDERRDWERDERRAYRSNEDPWTLERRLRDEDPSFDDRYRNQPLMSRREAEDFSRRIGEGEWGWGARGRDHEHRDHRDHRGGRGFLDQARDAVQSMFRSDDGHRDRRDDHRGRGPRGYRRSDARIQEDVCDRLTEDSYLDASDIEVRVEQGEVILAGTVRTREDKRRAERLAEDCAGVDNVQNSLRVEERSQPARAYGSARGSSPLVSGAGGDQEAGQFLARGRWERDRY